MRKVAFLLILGLAVVWSGCGSSSAPIPLATYVARANANSWAPFLFTFNRTTKTATAVAIPVPANADFVSFNKDNTAASYCYVGDITWDIFLMGTDGVEHQLTTDADACESVFSPDGKSIAYVAGAPGNFEIFTMGIDGTNQTAVYVDDSGLTNDWIPSFSADSKSLVFYVEYSAPSASKSRAPRPSGHVSSWAQQAHQNAKSHRAGHAQVSGDAPTQSGWYKMALTDASPTLVWATSDWWGPASYSADGKKLLMTVYDGTEWNIASVNLDGSGFTALTASTTTEYFSPVPSGTLILFNVYNNTNTSADIYVMDQAGANQTLLSTSPVSEWDTLIDSYWGD